MDDDDLDILIAEITTDAHDIDEQLWGFLGYIEEEAEFPVRARVIGHQVDLIGVSYDGNEQRGLVAMVQTRRGGHEVAFADVFIEESSAAVDLLAAYKRWMGL